MGAGRPDRSLDGARPPRSRRLQAHQRLQRPRRRRPGPAPGRHDDGGLHAPLRPGVPDRRRRVRDRSSRTPTPRAPRSWSAGCSPPASTARPVVARRTPSPSRPGISAGPSPAKRPRGALPPGRQRAVLEQAPRSHVRDHLRRRAPRQPRHRTPAGRALRGRRAGRRDRRHPGGLPADLRPVDRRAARLRGPRAAVARQRVQRPRLAVRGGRGDRADERARHRLPQHGHGDRRPPAPARVADGQPVAADARERRLQRPCAAADDRPARPRSAA